jgi:hypothetical protein
MAAVVTPFPSKPRARKGGPTLVLFPARAKRYAVGSGHSASRFVTIGPKNRFSTVVPPTKSAN